MMQLKHSHIAIPQQLRTLASAAMAEIAEGQDDLAPYRYFDLELRKTDGSKHTVRFASHEGDAMVHVLAEDTREVAELAAALRFVGLNSKSKLSISTDHKGQPLRDEQEIRDRISATLKSTRSEEQKVRPKNAERPRYVWKGPFVDGYLIKKAEKVRKSGRSEVIKTWSSRSAILPQFIGLTFDVAIGRKHVKLQVTKDMVGHRFYEFAKTSRFQRLYSLKNKIKKEK